jgi:membrane protease YdiL (CAAX protease family)
MVALAFMVAAGIVAASLFCWTLAIFKRAAGLPLVAWNDRRRVPWAFFDLLALVAIHLAVGVAVFAGLYQLDWLSRGTKLEEWTLAEREVVTLANVAVSLLVLLVGLSLIALRTGATLVDFGWSAASSLGDLKLGAIAFVMLATPVYALQAALVHVWPSKHPLIEMFKGTPNATFFAILLLAAVIVAPIFEELVFRVLLQGFLEKAFSFRGPVHELFFGEVRRTSVPIHEAEPAPKSTELARAIAPPAERAESINPYASPQAPPVPAAEPVVAPSGEERCPPLRGPAAWWPIAISSLVFALLHYDHGPDWIPLTLLAVGMGYLYQRTHRLLPSLIVHMALNGVSMWGLWLQVYEAGGSGIGARG